MKNFKNIKNIVGVFALSAIIVSCDVDNTLDEIVDPEIVYAPANAGSADFSNFISLGNSLTHGVVDGTVFIASQENSFPNIMANQMKAMGGGEFIQPLVDDNIGGLLYGGQEIAGPRLYFNGAGPAYLDATPTTEVTNKISGPFNNFGVGGARSFHLIAPGYGSVPGVLQGTANPYFARMSSSETASVLEDAVATNPTFFSLWIGNNDVLGYATSGGDASSSTITDTPTFNFAMSTLVETLTANGAKGIIANIPNVSDLPFFTTVPYNPVPLDAATAGQLNTGYAAYNAGIQQAFAFLVANTPMTQEMADAEIAIRTITFAEGQNAVVIEDEYLTDLTAINSGLKSWRQTTEADLITLPTSSILPSGAGTATPLLDGNVLTADEQEEISVATATFNATIASLASQKGLALYDANARFEVLANEGVQFGQYLLNASLVFGGAISLDGIHPTPRGYAFIAKEMLGQIDATYGSNFDASGNVPKADDFTTNFSPALR
jgi:lysophospholipase L1-like esterase